MPRGKIPLVAGKRRQTTAAGTRVNRLLSYADDTTLLVPTHSDVELAVKQWAKDEWFIISQTPKRLSLDSVPQNCFLPKFSSPEPRLSR